ncbi:MAG: ABC transporter permease, partial [Agathobacter sp.]|nr:ABC transporter permease [Agathobacter sp.]
MNIFGKVTLRNLQKNKTRTLVTMIGIILSTAMFTAVTTTISSLQEYMVDYNVYSEGNWYGAGFSLNREEAENLSNSDEVAQSVSLGNVGYAYLENSTNSYKPYLFVGSMGESFTEQMPVHLTEGRLPENSTEIILPTHLEKNGGISYEIGEVLNLSIGERTWEGTTLNNHLPFYIGDHLEDFREFSQDGSTILLGDETWIKSFDVTYTVVGFYERPAFEDYSAPGYTALTYGVDSALISSYDVFYTTKSGKDAISFTEKQSFYPDNGQINIDLLRLYGYSEESSYNEVLYGLAAILIGIIAFGSISLIYNAFSISVSERTKQFGILSSIGATKKQLLSSVIYEALYLSVIAIPLGILSGLIGMGVTFHFVGSSLASLMYNAPGVELGLHPSIGAIITAAVVALLTILISAYLPARKALKQPVMDAIRQNNDIKISSRKVRTNPLIAKLFGFEGMIAVKNYKRSKKKYRATVFSLFISVVLFITASSFCEYLT